MTPTLAGRLQTRVVLFATVGVLWTLIIGPVLPGTGPGAAISAVYRGAFGSLVVVLLLGLVWELVYHGLQQFRWDKDWPTLFGLTTALNEGLAAWSLIVVGDVLGQGLGSTTFITHFVSTWLVIWMVANGPLRVVLLRWRFRGGRIIDGRSRSSSPPIGAAPARNWMANAPAAVTVATGGPAEHRDAAMAPRPGADNRCDASEGAFEPIEASARGWGVPPEIVRGVVCAKCGGFNPLSVSHCVYDGNRLNATVFAAVDDDGHMVIGELGSRPPLGLLTGPDGREVRVDCDLVIGREPTVSSLVDARQARPVVADLTDLGVSRVHCSIDLADWMVFVRDAGSNNGTFHRSAENDVFVRVPAGRAVRLNGGDAIRVGAQVFIYSAHF